MTLPSRFTAWLTVNRSCNLRCTWCYAKDTGFAHDNMSLETATTAIALLKSMPVKTVHLIGGEPTIHPDFLRIVSMVKEAGMEPGLITNGIALSKMAFLEQALDAGLHGIVTSLKASSGEQYRRHTGTDAYARAICAIQNVETVRLTRPLTHRVAITMCRDLFEGIDDLIKTMVDCRATEFTIDAERPTFVGGVAQPVEGVTPQEMANLMVRAHPKFKASGLRCLMKIGLPFCLFPDEFISELRERGELVSGCQLIGGTGIIIDPNGKILPCNHFCDRPIGQIKPGFDAKAYQAFREEAGIRRFYRAMGGCPDKKCQDCRHWSACCGGCRVHWFANSANTLLGKQ